jgi:hypothetical protein
MPVDEALRALETREGHDLDPAAVAALRALAGRGVHGVAPPGPA